MSKFDQAKSVISHWKNEGKIVSIDTNLYIFGEAQATAKADYYDYTTWEWDGKIVKIKEVGIHPTLKSEQQ
jgi:hypothetical protein